MVIIFMVNPIELQKYLKGVDYPASKQELLDKAGENGAGADVTDALSALPDGSYGNPVEVQSALGTNESQSDEEEIV